ncbi:MAG: transporter [Sphingobacteriales bacterium]|nr:transporter [Sphingobacteriales bacterium]
MKKGIICATLILSAIHLCYSQGCVAIRSINGFGQYSLSGNAFTVSNWQININNRYFKAYRDFKNSTDQKTPEQNQSITKSYTTEILVSRIFNKGWAVALSIPYLINSRETNGEHGGPNTARHTTHAVGIGDIRISGYKWLIAPRVTQKFNVQVGLGIKFPTGDYKYQDNFFRDDNTYVSAPVNPAIQLVNQPERTKWQLYLIWKDPHCASTKNI